jgi:HEPN domain-containing protein
MALVEKAGIAPEETRAALLQMLSEFYVDSRYPEAGGVGSGDIERQRAEDCLKKTQELLKWLTTFRKT